MKTRKPIIACQRCGNMTETSPCEPCKQMTQPHHTPTPWKKMWDETRKTWLLIISATDYGPFIQVREEADAAFIVRAVNTYQAHKELEELIVRCVDLEVSLTPEQMETHLKAIAKAEGK